jgi:uncharacterized protein (TIGR00296 family)
MMMLDQDGEKAVRLARRVVESHLRKSSSSDSAYVADFKNNNNTSDDSYNLNGNTACGVFVTLNYLDGNKQEHLRGCIGFPMVEKSLYYSILDASIAAATQDPRFPPVNINELAEIIFEVSILTPPVEIKVQNPKDYLNVIKVGRDGLILKWKDGSGLLLPQVPVELNWDTEEYLANLCYKAGAPPDIWLMSDSKLFSFQANIYKESYPNGNVIRMKL